MALSAKGFRAGRVVAWMGSQPSPMPGATALPENMAAALPCSIFTPVEGIVKARGARIPSGNRQAVHARDGGLVWRVFTHEASMIRQGEPRCRTTWLRDAARRVAPARPDETMTPEPA